MTIADNIKRIREKYDLTQDELGEIAGVSGGAVSTWERGTAEPRMGAIQKIADTLNISKSSIVEDSEPTLIPIDLGDTVRIPVYGRIPAGVPREAIEDISDYIDVEKRIADKYNLLALEVVGDSMYPTYLNGDYVLIKEQPDCESGQVCAVRINGDDVTLKKVIKEIDGIMLQPINPEYAPKKYDYNDEQNPVTIVGVVIELRRKVG